MPDQAVPGEASPARTGSMVFIYRTLISLFLVVHFVTKVWSDGGQTRIDLTIRLPDARSNATARRWKKRWPAIRG